MLSVFGCVITRHNLWLVLVAALICVAGAWTIMRLFQRARDTRGLQAAGWHFLTAVAAGGSIWCTHFIAVLAYDAPDGFVLDPVLTIASLIIAIGGCAIGLAIAASPRPGPWIWVGGAFFGLAIAAMHYTGMMAYRTPGLVRWNMTFLVASIALATVLSPMAFLYAVRNRTADRYIAIALLVLAIVSLHFTGMTALTIVDLNLPISVTNTMEIQALAMAVAVVGLLITGTGFASYLIDGATRTDSVRALRQLALNDTLTGMPNRAAFKERLTRDIATGQPFTLVAIDLDRFKEINDVRGHAAGDEVLKVSGRRMAAIAETEGFAARLGGDEFVLLLPDTGMNALIPTLNRLNAALLRPIRLEDFEVSVGASFGVACFPEDADTAEALVNNADLAMYRAKSDLVDKICFYEASMDEAVRNRRAMASDLREAVRSQAFEVYYQKQTSIRSGDVVGYEALLRWNHPERGFVSPADFIPLAEETGVILELGEWVLRTACIAAAGWPDHEKVAVNLSPVQFAHADLPALVGAILNETGLPPHRLELELTESTIIADKARSLRSLRRIKALGVTVALDDFGTGYSSLETLRTFPFDKIKLDRSFMSEIETSPQAKAIVRAVLALGKSLEVPVLAEGIETPAQLSILADEGCDEGQGYYLGRPAPLGQIDHPAVTPKRRRA